MKRSILNINLKKYPRQIRHPVIDLKMELLVKIVTDFKLCTFRKKIHIRCVTGSEFASYYNSIIINQPFFTNNKRALSLFFGTVTLTTQPEFYFFKVKNRNTKNDTARCDMV